MRNKGIAEFELSQILYFIVEFADIVQSLQHQELAYFSDYVAIQIKNEDNPVLKLIHSIYRLSLLKHPDSLNKGCPHRDGRIFRDGNHKVFHKIVFHNTPSAAKRIYKYLCSKLNLTAQ